MKTKIKYITILMFSLYVLVSENAFSQAIYVHLYDDVWAVCPEGDKNGDGNLTSADGCYHAIIKQTLTIDGGGGGAGISIPTNPIPDDPFSQPTTGGSKSDPSSPSDPSSDNGNTITEPPVPRDIGDKTDPILPQVCHCNVCPDCGGCILEYGESLPSGCETLCKCCNKNFCFLCIEHIFPKTEIKTILSELWSFTIVSFELVIFQVNVFLHNVINEVWDLYNLNNKKLKIELKYDEGSVYFWSGNIKFVCNSQKILQLSNVLSYFSERGPIGAIAYLKIYSINTQTGEQQLIITAERPTGSDYIPINSIDRLGIPKVGENIYQIFSYYPPI